MVIDSRSDTVRLDQLPSNSGPARFESQNHLAPPNGPAGPPSGMAPKQKPSLESTLMALNISRLSSSHRMNYHHEEF